MTVDEFAAVVSRFGDSIDGSKGDHRRDDGQSATDDRLAHRKSGGDGKEGGEQGEVARCFTTFLVLLEDVVGRRRERLHLMFLLLAADQGGHATEGAGHKNDGGQPRQVPAAHENREHRDDRTSNEKRDGKVDDGWVEWIGQSRHASHVADSAAAVDAAEDARLAVSDPRECSRSARRSDPTPGPKDKIPRHRSG